MYIDSFTTVQDANDMLQHELNLHGVSKTTGYCIFEVRNLKERKLNPEEYMCDLLALEEARSKKDVATSFIFKQEMAYSLTTIKNQLQMSIIYYQVYFHC